MSYFDRDILISNINKLMQNNNVTQKQLGEILGMSQPNVNHALNPNQKKCFTLDQITGIANHFHVSIDELVRGRKPKDITTGPRATAALLAHLIANHDISYFEHKVEEDIFEIDFEGDNGAIYPTCTHKTEDVPYYAFYLPSYWKVPMHPLTESEAELLSEATQVGNETSMQPVNEFLQHFLEIQKAYENGSLTKETYQLVLDDLLSHLRE